MTTARADLPTIRLRRGPEAATVLRALARVTLILGALLAGFIVYQFGVTTFLATRAQGGLRTDLAIRVAAAETIVVPYEPLELPEAPVVIPPDLPTFVLQAVPGLDPIELVPAGTDPVSVPGGELPGENPVGLITEPKPTAGAAIGRIVIPNAGVDWAFVEGVGSRDLQSGAGHMPETALPGQPGNSVISGHRTTYGAPFLHLDRVAPGDFITVENATGRHVYQVVEKMVVAPTDTWVTGQWEGAWLTLTTCEPVFSASQRLVVVATLVAGPNSGVILDGS